MKKSKIGIGLDINNHHLCLVQLRREGTGLELLQHYHHPLPPGWVDAGQIRDFPGVSSLLAEAVAATALRGQKVVTALNGQQVYTRSLCLPWMPMDELRQAAQLQALNFLPIPSEETVMDISPCRISESDEGKQVELFFVAARRQRVEELEHLCQRAGLRAAAIETEADALFRLSPLEQDETAAVLYLEDQRWLLSIGHANTPLLFRYFSPAANPPDLLPAPNENDWSQALSRGFEDFQRQHPDLNCRRLLLGGPGATEHQAHLQTLIPCPVQRWDPLAQLKIKQEYDPVNKDLFLLAIGLACR